MRRVGWVLFMLACAAPASAQVVFADKVVVGTFTPSTSPLTVVGMPGTGTLLRIGTGGSVGTDVLLAADIPSVFTRRDLNESVSGAWSFTSTLGVVGTATVGALRFPVLSGGGAVQADITLNNPSTSTQEMIISSRNSTSINNQALITIHAWNTSALGAGLQLGSGGGGTATLASGDAGSLSLQGGAVQIGTSGITTAITLGAGTTPVSIAGGVINLTNATSNMISWAATGVGPPTLTTRSVGSKLVLYPNTTSSSVDFALGIEGGNMWFATPAGMKWYVNAAPTLTLDSSVFTVNAGATVQGPLLMGGKISLNNAATPGPTRGLYMWTSTDTNWGIYMAQSGAGQSLAGGNATTGGGAFTAHAIRFRVSNNDSQGFIWENSTDPGFLMSLSGGTGILMTRNVLPVIDSTYYLGNGTNRWRSAYFNLPEASSIPYVVVGDPATPSSSGLGYKCGVTNGPFHISVPGYMCASGVLYLSFQCGITTQATCA